MEKKNIWTDTIKHIQDHVNNGLRGISNARLTPDGRGISLDFKLEFRGQSMPRLDKRFEGCKLEINGESRGLMDITGQIKSDGMRIGLNNVVVREPN